MIEDNDADADAVVEALGLGGDGVRVLRVSRLADGLKSIETGGVGAVVLDLSLPDASGLSGLRRIRATAPAIPVLVLTGTRDDRLCAQALHEGAQDYLVKGDLEGASMARKIHDAFERQLYSTRASILAEERARVALAEQRRASWLSEAGRLLSSSLDYQATLDNIRSAVVPFFADRCAVALAEKPDEPIDHETAEHAILFEHVLRTGRPWFDDEAQDALVVPMTIGDRRIGAIALTLVPPRARFSLADRLLAEDLGHRAALALENANLYRQSRAAVRLRDEFLSIASHELRTPLSALQLQIQILQLKVANDDAPPPREEVLVRLANCVGQTTRVARLVATLLDVSLIASGQIALKREQLELRSVVDDTIERLRAESSAPSTALIFEPGDEVVGWCDRLRLEQVVTNLVTNGVKYGAGRSVRVALHADKTHAFLAVHDGGIGIAPEDLQRIFGRFERAGSARHYSGLGLGLYVTRQIVEAHGGTVVVESEFGVGSTFTVKLPLGLAARSSSAAGAS
ncbi:MAG: hypothetical protein NVSMB25_26170 [Thermoleophilaceae bacterium]